MAIKAKPRFQPQAVARAQADGQHFRLGQQRAGDLLGVGAFDGNLKAVFAGIAGAADDGGRAGDGGAATCMKVSSEMPGEWRSSTRAAGGPCSASKARSGRGVSVAAPFSFSAI